MRGILGIICAILSTRLVGLDILMYPTLNLYHSIGSNRVFLSWFKYVINQLSVPLGGFSTSKKQEFAKTTMDVWNLLTMLGAGRVNDSDCLERQLWHGHGDYDCSPCVQFPVIFPGT